MDAVGELRRWHAAGGRFLKWLPNTMGIEPSDLSLTPFYAEMARLGVVLLSHAGSERAVGIGENPDLGNPLLLRPALAAAVRVVVLHCASQGRCADLDDPARPLRPAFDLFLRMMEDPRWEGRLFGEISGATQVNRMGTALAALLDRPALHARLVNGSDYPLPAVNVLIWTRRLAWGGYVTRQERAALNEIYRHNPLLFDFVCKRVVRSPAAGNRFAPSVFEVPEALADAFGVVPE